MQGLPTNIAPTHLYRDIDITSKDPLRSEIEKLLKVGIDGSH
jgi:hypothetical protein